MIEMRRKDMIVVGSVRSGFEERDIFESAFTRIARIL